MADYRHTLATRRKEVPADLRKLGDPKLDVRRYLDFHALLEDGSPLTPEQVLRQVLQNTDIDILLKTIGLGFKPRVVTVSPTAVEIIPPHQYARGYIILNPAEISGVGTQVTFFASALRTGAAAPGTTYTSTAFNVSGVDDARVFLDITAVVGAPTLTVNVQTQDPLTGNWATAQSDIFSGAVTVGTFYANLGAVGVDRLMRLQAVVVGAGTSVTFSISGLLKGSSLAPVGTTVYIGPPSVNTTMGFPILPGGKEVLYLRKNVTLWAITQTETLVLKVFELQ